MKNKVLIFGNGYLGNKIKDDLENKKNSYVVKLSLLDITDYQAIENEIKKYRPEIIFNCAAKTELDWCEINKKKSAEINIKAAVNLARLAKKYNVYLIHFSSLSMFDSKGNAKNTFSENDKPNPVCFYGYAKAMADKLMEKYPVLILRLGVLISSDVTKRNFILKIIASYNELIDEKSSFTYVDDLLKIINHFLITKKVGLYHVVNSGLISPYQMYLLSKKYIKNRKNIKKTTRAKLNKATIAKRSSPIVSIAKIRKENIKLIPIKEAVKKCLKKLKKYART